MRVRSPADEFENARFGLRRFEAEKPIELPQAAASAQQAAEAVGGQRLGKGDGLGDVVQGQHDGAIGGERLELVERRAASVGPLGCQFQAFDRARLK